MKNLQASNFVLGNHAFAIVCGKECYESMATSFKEVMDEINKLIAEGAFEVDGKIIPLKFFLGGDYKVIILHTVAIFYTYFIQNVTNAIQMLLASCICQL